MDAVHRRGNCDSEINLSLECIRTGDSMNVGDYVFVIKPDDPFYGQKCIIRAVATDFSGKITGYTVIPYHSKPCHAGENRDSENGGTYRDYASEDVQYTTRRRRTMTPQMQLL